MYAQQAREPRQSRPKFAPGDGRWPRSSSTSDSDTEHEDESPLRKHTTPPRGSYIAAIQQRRRQEPPSPHDRPPSADGHPTAASVDSAPSDHFWSAKRHLTCGNPTPHPPWSSKSMSWRSSSSGKLKTAAAGLVICLNSEVDPPDIVKTRPCATLECWVDPQTLPSAQASEAIGMNLQSQFEGLSLKIQYKNIHDPTFEELRKSCINLRKIARDDAVLFHYNGHGVPKPTASGELWCFNKNYTQYIPVSLTEIQKWIGSPGVYIWDCSAAGNLLENFVSFADRLDKEQMMRGGYPPGTHPFKSALQLAACASHEHLPSCPELPADVFTSCLTSPIDIAVRYFIMTHQLPNNLPADIVQQVPGDLKDRRTPLGELNWIFTAITDTIAWTTFSRETFSRLYRSDLLIASLFRNFLLAERIMKNYNCTPHTYPRLLPTNTHALWATWDHAVDTCLRQLPEMLQIPTEMQPSQPPNLFPVAQPGRIGKPYTPKNGEKSPYTGSRFFADQLTAFEVWISRGGSALTRRGPLSLPGSSEKNGEIANEYHEQDSTTEGHLVPRKPPDQLPIVLQVLLSQPHRLRALILLSQFVDLGPWAVNLVLSIGIFPYISKLLQAPGQDLRPVLIFIWARILAVDPTVQVDLLNNLGYRYFAKILAIPADSDALPNADEHQAMCSFILSALARGFPAGQDACWQEKVFIHCYERLDASDFLMRQWSALCIGQMWDGHDAGRMTAVEVNAQDRLLQMLSDDSAEVRCAALFALGTFMGASGSPNRQGGGGSGTMPGLDPFTHQKMEVSCVTGATLGAKDDASPMCRKELLVVISCLVKEWRGHFVVCAWIYWEEDRQWREHNVDRQGESITDQAVSEWLDIFGDDELVREQTRQLLSSFFTVFVVLLNLSVDPYPEVAAGAQTILDYIMALLLDSPFSRLDCATLYIPPAAPSDYRAPGSDHLSSSPTTSTMPPPSPSVSRPNMPRSDTMNTISSGVSSTIRRTSSFASALKVIANGIAFPSMDESSAKSEAPAHSRPPSPNLHLTHYAAPYDRPQTSATRESSRERVDFLPSHVMEALTEEDMERLKARRRHRHHHGNGLGGAIPSPSESTFSLDSSASSILAGLGTGKGVKDVLPLRSTFFDWCTQYFTEPQMRQAEADEPGSVEYNYQVWRQQRNEQIDQDTQAQAEIAGSYAWDRSVVTLPTIPNPLTMTFHAYDHHLVVANESDIVSVWDWSTKRRLNYFCNGNPVGTSITSLQLINQEVGGILITGSSDGLVRLYRNYDPAPSQGPLQLVSAFRGLPEVIDTKHGAGVVMDWQQSSGILLVSGDSHVIKSWDAETELSGMDVDTGSDSPVTSLVTGDTSSNTLIAGFADGMVKVFDRRLEEEESIVRVYSDHTTWVQNVRPHPSISQQYLSASLDGEVKLWDLRGPDTAAQTWRLHPEGIAAFDVHKRADVFGGISSITPQSWKAHRVAMHSLMDEDRLLSRYTLSSGHTAPPLRKRPSPYIPRTTSFVFHPTEMLCGIGTPDGAVRIMGCKLP